jgi:hypothetical protein
MTKKLHEMKKALLILAISLGFLVACRQQNDLTSLKEQIEGRWRIESYTVERFHPVTNSVSTHVFDCAPGDYMDFTNDRVSVHFDSTAGEAWPYLILNHNTLLIEDKRWHVLKLAPTEFHLSLRDRDSSQKYRDVVLFELARP